MARFKIFDSAMRRGHRRQWMQGKAERRRYVLVVGGCGFLGHRIVETILADPDLRSKASASLSFGKMVWPHMMARLMLSEQLYRSASILAGSPYHRV